MTYDRINLSASHDAVCFLNPHSVQHEQVCIVPTQVVFDTSVVVESDNFDVYMMLECNHFGG